jgi:hypothetical protein
MKHASTTKQVLILLFQLPNSIFQRLKSIGYRLLCSVEFASLIGSQFIVMDWFDFDCIYTPTSVQKKILFLIQTELQV